MSGKCFYGFVSVLSFVHINVILLFPSFIVIFYQTNILRYPVHDVILSFSPPLTSNGFHIYYLFCNDNFLNAFEIVKPLNVVDVDILSKCCVC